MYSQVPLTPLTFLERSAQSFPHKSAIIYSEGVLTFSELLTRTRFLAQVLATLKVKKGDRVAVLTENSVQAIEAHFAIPAAKAVLVMLNPWLSETEIVALLDFSEAKVLIADVALYQKLTSFNRQRLEGMLRVLVINRPGYTLDPGILDYESRLFEEAEGCIPLEEGVHSELDPIAINFTSGTTGSPKGVIYSHRAGYLNALGQVLMINLTKESKYLWALPMFHVNGWGHMWACVAVGCTQIIPASNFTLGHAEDFISAIKRYQITHFAGAPRLLKMLSDIAYSNDFLRGISVVTGGSAPSPILIQKLEKLGVNLIHQYGLSETCGPFVVCEEQEEWGLLSAEARATQRARQGTATIHAGTGVRVLGADGKVVPNDGKTLGEVVMAGNTVAIGYYKNPEATQKAFRDGWFYSGDMAVVHPDGNLEIRDRIKDLIYVETEYGWENISSIEIENVICRNGVFQDAAVVAISDESRTDNSPLLVAFVELKDIGQVSEAEFHAYCATELAEYKRPQVVFFEKLPKTNTGKIRKDILSKDAKNRLNPSLISPSV